MHLNIHSLHLDIKNLKHIKLWSMYTLGDANQWHIAAYYIFNMHVLISIE